MEKKRIGHVISFVEEGSIASELDLCGGDILLRINGQEIEDVLDYHFLIKGEQILAEVEKADGEIWEIEIEKDYDEDLGIEFEKPLMDDYRSCCNKCIFCFIDQMPPGMRPTLYFKDDDSRLSFLQGNYVTLTNMSDHDIDRIIRYHMEPINISFHTLNPSLRCQMLNNRFAGEKALDKARTLSRAGIEMNGQIVLCKGVNDGEELSATLAGFEEYLPALKSVSVVPVGLTRYRDGLYPLEAFGSEDAEKVLSLIRNARDYYKEKYGYPLVHASDEWYLLAGLPLPEAEEYDGYPQLENGVGMLRLLLDETKDYLEELPGDMRSGTCTIASGMLAAPFLEEISKMIMDRFPKIRIRVRAVRNEFFGERITVSGLVTGRDLIGQLSGEDLGERLLLPCNMLRSDPEDGDGIFLDDVTVSDVRSALQTWVRIVESSGQDLVDACIEQFTEQLTVQSS